MKVTVRLIVIVLAGYLAGCTPSIYGLFRNSLNYSVTVTLLNPHKEAYCRIIIPPKAIKRCDVQYGTAQLADLTGRMTTTATIVQPGSERYFDFDRKTFYFNIKSSGVVPVPISEGRQWLIQQK